jgi:uncharacterized protein YciI
MNSAMQFLVLGYDGKDAEAPARRQKARPDHIKLGDEMVKKGEMLCGVALLDDKEQMIGSAIVCEFASREELDAWLEKEPYITGNVWQKVEVVPCRLGPSFAHCKLKV